MRKWPNSLALFLLLLALIAGSSATQAWPQQPRSVDGDLYYFPIVTYVPPTYYVTGDSFEAIPLDLEDFQLFDLGVVDIDADHGLDIYTVNHSARQSFLRNNGDGSYSQNLLSAYGFDQAPQFPGLEDSLDTPSLSSSGLYIYWHDSVLVFKTQQLSPQSGISGSVRFIPEIQVSAGAAFDFQLSSNPLPNGAVETILDFTAVADGEMLVTPLPKPSVGSPITVELESSLALNHIFVGSSAINPSDHTFLLHLKDRHGHAWANYDDDGIPDVYMSRGGNRGDSELYPLKLITDQFYVSNGDAYSPMAADTLGFVKDGCAARQVAWTDIDSDSRLDLYIVCARGDPNQLYRQFPDGHFSNIANDYGLGLRDDGDFVWLDADGDGDMDLFWAGTQDYRLYTNQGSSFVGQSVAVPDQRATKLTVSDYDLDGDPDIFAASSGQSFLFRNDGTLFTPVLPQSIGLPASALAANWVDYDNDGLVDLHTVPQGLFRQQPGRTFQSTGILRLEAGVATGLEARASWFDADGDGYRDLVIATNLAEADGSYGTQSGWFSGYFRNLGSSGNNWLAVDLVGLPPNRDAIGTVVTLQTKRGEFEQQVGWSEGARYSAGHYRLYFGLGTDPFVEQMTITWPNGDVDVMQEVPVNEVMVVQQSP